MSHLEHFFLQYMPAAFTFPKSPVIISKLMKKRQPTTKNKNLKKKLHKTTRQQHRIITKRTFFKNQEMDIVKLQKKLFCIFNGTQCI